MDREKAPESENFQTLFLQMGNQITHDPGGHAPDGVAPVEPHRDLYAPPASVGCFPLTGGRSGWAAPVRSGFTISLNPSIRAV